MKLIAFDGQTGIIAENQPEYMPMPAYINKATGQVTCAWKLSWRERLTLLCTGTIWHSILTFGQSLQPQLLEVEKPPMPKGGLP